MSSDAFPPLEPEARIAAAARAIALGTEPDHGLDTLIRLAAGERGADVAVLAAVDDDRTRLVHLGSLGVAAADLPAVELSTAGPSDPFAVAVLERRRVVWPGPDESGPSGELARRLGLARLEVRPLLTGQGGIDRSVGILALGWRSGAKPRDGNSQVQAALADLAAVAVDRLHQAAGAAERRDWSERLAHIDPLTGLANRRTLDRVLELEIARASRQGSEVSLAVFDVDAFRAINAEGGPAAGDEVLRAVAAVLAESVRLVDTVARIGGDEFVIVAPGSGGMTVAARVKGALAGLGEVGGRRPSVSAGVARFPADGTSADELLGRALDALDAARAGGHGSVAVAPGTAGSG
ncbi:MAG: diguanylate cyclase [Chloroflexi bacterium]|nr:diguanylate cyclase [Chloroflexota bacterium]